MARVLHVAQPTTEGVAVVVRALVLDQVRRGWDVAVACPAAGDLAGWTTQAGARHLAWTAGREPGPGVAGEVRALAGVVRGERPELVHLHSSKAGLAGRLAVRGRVPTVFSPHAWSFLAVRGAVASAALAWERQAQRWTDLTVAASFGEREQGWRHRVQGRYLVARNGVPVTRAPAPSARRRADARAALALDDAPLAVCVARVCRQKGQDVLLRAWPAVRERVPDARLVLLGDGPDLAAVRAAGVAGVQALGRRGDVQRWLDAGDVAVTASRWDGLSISMLEAMAAARAVVATDVDGVREAVEGVCSPVPVGDAAALAGVLAGLLADRAAADDLGARLHARALAEYDVDRTTAEVAAAYRDLRRR